jgi:hypothetical protein
MTWLPIAEAPKDGTLVDLWVGGAKKGKRLTDCYWSRTYSRLPDGTEVDDPHWCGWSQGPDEASSWNPYPPLISGKPTHFMLPPKGPT